MIKSNKVKRSTQDKFSSSSLLLERGFVDESLKYITDAREAEKFKAEEFDSQLH